MKDHEGWSKGACPVQMALHAPKSAPCRSNALLNQPSKRAHERLNPPPDARSSKPGRRAVVPRRVHVAMPHVRGDPGERGAQLPGAAPEAPKLRPPAGAPERTGRCSTKERVWRAKVWAMKR